MTAKTVPYENLMDSWPSVFHSTLRFRKRGPAFVRCKYGQLLHRVRCVTKHLDDDGNVRHESADFLCGNVTAGFAELLREPGKNDLVCARCEDAARRRSLPSADKIAGRHCHVGGIRVFKMCCRTEDQN